MDAATYLETDIAEIADRLGPAVQAFSGKTVVFTGACGFLGTYFMALFERLNRGVLKSPARVIACDNMISSAHGPELMKLFGSIRFSQHDIIRPMTVDEPVDYVLHAAGIASPIWYRTHPLETLDVATQGTRNMLDLARAKNAKFLHFSSSEIYGDPDSRHVPTSENYFGHVSCRGPRACYDEGKRVGETLCDIYHDHYGVHTVSVRPFNVYGPGLRERDYRVLPNFASRIKAGKPLLVYGSGRQTRTFCYVTDAVTGFLLAIVKGVSGEAYNIGNPNPEITMEELAQRLKSVAGDKVSYRIADYPDGYPSNEPQRRCPDIRKAELQLGFAPAVSLEEGLRRFLGWTDRSYSGAAD
jgi:UDP-glucuronate decarboxylase